MSARTTNGELHVISSAQKKLESDNRKKRAFFKDVGAKHLLHGFSSNDEGAIRMFRPDLEQSIRNHRPYIKQRIAFPRGLRRPCDP